MAKRSEIDQDWDLVSPHVDVVGLYGKYKTIDELMPEAYALCCEKLRLDDQIFERIASQLYYMGRLTDPPAIELPQIAFFFQNLFYALRENDWSILMQERGLKVDRIVGIEEFILSKHYLDQKRSTWKEILRSLVDLYEGGQDYFEAVLGGGIGIGKSRSACLGLAYDIYRLTCYHAPQLEYGLAPNSNITFVFQSQRLEIVKKAIFAEFSGIISGSPYFKRILAKGAMDRTTEIRFPGYISAIPLSSTATAALGLNVWGAALDELSFMAIVEDSAEGKLTGDGTYDQAQKLYTTMIRRIKSRFQITGKVPSKLFLLSSANYPDDFVERKVKEAETDLATKKKTHIYVWRKAQWEVQPAERFSKERFLVEVGNDLKPSRIIKSREEAIDPEDVIEFPEDYRDDVTKDIDGTIRDFAGKAVGGSNIFIRQRAKIFSAVEAHKKMCDGHQLFALDQVDLSIFESKLDQLFNEMYLSTMIDGSVPFAAHLDFGLTGDSGGLSLGHTLSYQKIGRVVNWDEATKTYTEIRGAFFPVIQMDGTLEVRPPIGGEIDLNTVADLLQLIASRVNLVYVTADQYQSVMALQRIRKLKNCYGNKIKSGVISVDASLAPYSALKQGLRDDRLLLTPVPKLQTELKLLQFDPKKQKIDHGKGGSKDLADTVAGVCYILEMKRESPATSRQQPEKTMQRFRRGRH